MRVPSSLRTQEVIEWWTRLTRNEQRSLVSPRPPLLARFVEAGSEPADDGNLDLYEWLIGHEIIVEDRVFHICSAHQDVRTALSKRLIVADFVCPLRSSTCPMRAILDLHPGKDLSIEGGS
jgi:hypothetical protein